MKELTSTNNLYADLPMQAESLLKGETFWVSNLAQVSALLFQQLNEHFDGTINWAGFYLIDQSSELLRLGPFQGKIACTQIRVGKGVVGTCALTWKTINVPNVFDFKGHIACDSVSKSELVIPLIQSERLLGVLDIDSTEFNTFQPADIQAIEKVVDILVKGTTWDNFKKTRNSTK